MNLDSNYWDLIEREITKWTLNLIMWFTSNLIRPINAHHYSVVMGIVPWSAYKVAISVCCLVSSSRWRNKQLLMSATTWLAWRTGNGIPWAHAGVDLGPVWVQLLVTHWPRVIYLSVFYIRHLDHSSGHPCDIYTPVAGWWTHAWRNWEGDADWQAGSGRCWWKRARAQLQ